MFSFLFRNETREGCTDWNQQRAYSLVDTNPVSFLMIYITNKIKEEQYFCLLGHDVREDYCLLCPLDFHCKNYPQQPPVLRLLTEHLIKYILDIP